MFHAVLELVYSEYVDVQVVSALVKIAVQHVPEVVDTLSLGMPERVRTDGLGVGNAVERVFIRQLRH